MKELIIDILKWLGMDSIKQQIVDVIYYFMMWLAWLFIGIIGMISTSITRGKSLTVLQIFASMGCGMFAGTLTYLLCIWQHINPMLGGVLTSLSCMLGKELCAALLAIDYKGTLKEKFAYLLQAWAEKLKPNKDKP